MITFSGAATLKAVAVSDWLGSSAPLTPTDHCKKDLRALASDVPDFFVSLIFIFALVQPS